MLMRVSSKMLFTVMPSIGMVYFLLIWLLGLTTRMALLLNMPTKVSCGFALVKLLLPVWVLSFRTFRKYYFFSMFCERLTISIRLLVFCTVKSWILRGSTLSCDVKSSDVPGNEFRGFFGLACMVAEKSIYYFKEVNGLGWGLLLKALLPVCCNLVSSG